MTTDEAVVLAKHAVLGILTARRAGSAQDAAFMIEGYLTECLEAGMSLPQAWVAFFSASTVMLDSMLEVAMATQNKTSTRVIQDLALSLSGTL